MRFTALHPAFYRKRNPRMPFATLPKKQSQHINYLNTCRTEGLASFPRHLNTCWVKGFYLPSKGTLKDAGQRIYLPSKTLNTCQAEGLSPFPKTKTCRAEGLSLSQTEILFPRFFRIQREEHLFENGAHTRIFFLQLRGFFLRKKSHTVANQEHHFKFGQGSKCG